MHVRGPAARVLELGQRAHQAQLLAQPAVQAGHRAQADLTASIVELRTAPLQAGAHRTVKGSPQRRAERRARPTGAEGVGRQPGRSHRIDVRDEGRARHGLQLGGQRRRQGEDVVHHHVGPRGGHRGPGLGDRSDDRLVGLQRPFLGGEHRVLGRRHEAHPVGLHVIAPARPRLEGHIVAAGGQFRAQSEHREGVAGLPEGPEEEAQRTGRAQAASSATARSCSIRSWRSKAIGVTIRVPTPASR